MPLTKIQKEEAVAGLQAEFAGARNAVLIDYLGLTVEEVNELRQKVRDAEGRYRVVKNTLARLAIEGTPLAELKDLLTGPIGIAYHEDSPVAIAKAMTEFVKEHKVVEIRGGVMDGRVADQATVHEFATMPSMEDLQAKLVFLLQSPLQRTVSLLQTVQSNFLSVLSQGAEKKEG